MIELVRYARVKPKGLVSASVTPEGDVKVLFKRFDVEDGREVDPETCLLTFAEIEARYEEIKKELEVVQELLALKP